MRGPLFLGLIAAAALVASSKKKKPKDAEGGSSSGDAAGADGDDGVEEDVDDILDGGEGEASGGTGGKVSIGKIDIGKLPGPPLPAPLQPDAPLDDIGSGGSPGGWGALPPYSPPQTPRPTPSKPGLGIKKKAQPSGNLIIPTVADPVDCEIESGSFYIDYPSSGDFSEEIYKEGMNLAASESGKDFPFDGYGLSELAEGTLQVYLPNFKNDPMGERLAALQEFIAGWACIFGFKAAVFLGNVPPERAFTARAWYRGNVMGEYDLSQSFSISYLDTAARANALPEFFKFGLVEWLHGAA